VSERRSDKWDQVSSTRPLYCAKLMGNYSAWDHSADYYCWVPANTTDQNCPTAGASMFSTTHISRESANLFVDALKECDFCGK
jgi:hypothetical protein